MSLCQICKIRPEQIGVVIGDQYYHLCYECKPLSHVSSGHARWNRSIDAEDHEADIQQPWGSDGKPNPKFIRLYRDKASHIFTDKEMRDAEVK